MLRDVLEEHALIEREIAQAITDALGRFGMAGQVRIAIDTGGSGAACAVLEGHGPTVREPIAGLAERWSEMSEDSQRRHAQDLARRLVALRRAASMPPRGPSRLSFLGPLFGLLAVGGGAYAGYRYLVVTRQDAALASASRAASNGVAPAWRKAEKERAARAERVCNAARARVVRGATLGPTDVEGWVVELTLLAPSAVPLGRSAALPGLVATDAASGLGRWVWPGAPDLLAAGEASPGIDLVDASYTVKQGQPLRSLSFVMQGGYVDAFFREERRGPYLGVAHAAAERLGTPYAALYARCGAGKTHHMGAWFRGPGVAGASASLIYFMGTYASVSHVSLKKLGAAAGPPLDRPAVLEMLERAAAPLTREQVRTVIGEHGGMIAGRDGGPVSLSFPFTDGNRASRASHALARAIGVGTEN